jgi:sugar-specific transcriptional regulator TrmB
MLKKEFVKEAREVFDLNEYEVKLWLALLSKGVATAGELSDISNVPRSRCYDVLESLEKKGFVMMKVGKPIQHIAIEPKTIIKRVKKNLEEDVGKQLKRVENIKGTDMFGELELLFKNNLETIDPSSLSGSIRGRKNIFSVMENMLSSAENEVIIFSTPEGLVRQVNQFEDLFLKLAQRGVKIKLFSQSSPELKEILNEYKGTIKFKEIDIKARFIIVDRNNMLFVMTPEEKVTELYEIGLWINTPYFASAVSALVDIMVK